MSRRAPRVIDHRRRPLEQRRRYRCAVCFVAATCQRDGRPRMYCSRRCKERVDKARLTALNHELGLFKTKRARCPAIVTCRVCHDGHDRHDRHDRRDIGDVARFLVGATPPALTVGMTEPACFR